MFDVVCSRKASGPWETPGITGAAVVGWEGPGCGIPAVAGGAVVAVPGVVVAAAAAAIGDSPIAGPEGLRFSMACQCCSRSLCLCIRLFFRSNSARRSDTSWQKKRSPYSATERRVLELIPVLGSQPAGDVSHKPDGRLPLLSARPAVTPATLKRAATNFAVWWTEAQ